MTGLELDSASGRLDLRVPRWVTFLGVAALAAYPTACGAGPAAADLPRTTGQGIHITVSVSEELTYLPGCRTQWVMIHDEEPPPGTCEQTMTMRLFTGEYDGKTVEASVVGVPNVNPLYAMGLVSRNLTEDVSVVVVVPPLNATAVRLTDASGKVVDEVTSSNGLVALAGLGSDLTAEAVDAAGAVIAACPPEGLLIGEILFECTLAPGATVPSTTIPAEEP